MSDLVSQIFEPNNITLSVEPKRGRNISTFCQFRGEGSMLQGQDLLYQYKNNNLNGNYDINIKLKFNFCQI
jgi:hypothetical protein